MTDELTYLAAPYSHKDKAVVLDRFLRINKVASYLMAKGECIFSPISHTHPIAEAGELPRGWDYWERYDTVMVSRCQKLYVLMLEGWQQSTGVTAEIKLALTLNIPIRYISESICLT